MWTKLLIVVIYCELIDESGVIKSYVELVRRACLLEFSLPMKAFAYNVVGLPLPFADGRYMR